MGKDGDILQRLVGKKKFYFLSTNLNLSNFIYEEQFSIIALFISSLNLCLEFIFKMQKPKKLHILLFFFYFFFKWSNLKNVFKSNY